MTEPGREERGGVSEALRSAIERTFAATADSAAGTRERAAEVVDDIARRGQEAREEVSRRGHEAREEVSRRGHEAREEVSRRGQEAREEVSRRGHEAREAPRAIADRIGSLLERLRGGEPSEQRTQAELERLRRRVEQLEAELKSQSKRKG